MEYLEKLLERIGSRVNINLRAVDFDVRPFLRGWITPEKFSNLSALCGLSTDHALHFRFVSSSLAGSYFLDRCVVESSIVYKSDLRGDELQRKGDVFQVDGLEIVLTEDEEIQVKDSLLVQTLVHSHSHDPNNPERFLIQKTVSMPYANIHGSQVVGSFLGAGATIDLTVVLDSVVGEFAYVQAGEVAHHYILPGQVWIHAAGVFDFRYTFPPAILARYIKHEPGQEPTGLLVHFIQEREQAFEQVYQALGKETRRLRSQFSAISPLAIVRGECRLDDRVFISQRAYVEDSWIGQGSNVQENCFIVSSHLSGFNVTAHGGKVSHARLGRKVFVGFNSFLNGAPDRPIDVGQGSIIMPHTIIDPAEPITIPPETLVWGYVHRMADLETQSRSIADMAKVFGEIEVGAMAFRGRGLDFIESFQNRIEHILASNGAYFDGEFERGHAQRSQNISINIIQPYPDGPQQGMFPTLDLRP